MKRVFLLLLVLSQCFTSFAVAADIKDEAKAKSINPLLQSAKDSPPALPEELIEPEQVEDSRFYYEFIKMLFTLGIIIVMIFFLVSMMKRMSNVRIEQTNLQSAIKILEKRPLSPKTTIYLLNIYNKSFVISDSQNGATLLSEVSLPPSNE